MTKVAFSVEGEWVTEHIRSMFWDDRRDYAEIEDTAATLFGFPSVHDMEPDMARTFQKNLADIIECRKRFSGINSFTLEDEPDELYRPMSIALREAQEREAISAIRADIEIHPYKYLDPWSTMKSVDIAKMLWQNKFSNSLDGIFDFQNFMRSRFWGSGASSYFEGAFTGTDCGLWLMSHPTLIYRAGGRASVEAENFWDNICQMTENDPDLAHRNARYIESASLDPNSMYFDRDKWNAHQEYLQQVRGNYDRYLVEQGRKMLGEPSRTTDEEYNAMTPAQFDKSDFYRIERSSYVEREDIYNYTGFPDDIALAYGLVDRSGRWYSCAFAGHERKAEAILITNWQDFDFSDADEYINDHGRKYPSSAKDVDCRMDAAAFCSSHDVLTFIIEKCGFIAIRWLPTTGTYLTYPSDPKWKATSAQKNMIWDAAVKHELEFACGEEVII